MFLQGPAVPKNREVLHGVGADGVGMKLPIFAVNCCCLPFYFRTRREKRRKTKKDEEKRKKSEKCVKKGENHSDPIDTNPIKNLPKEELKENTIPSGAKKRISRTRPPPFPFACQLLHVSQSSVVPVRRSCHTFVSSRAMSMETM